MDKITNLLVPILLIEMMLATGLGISWSDLGSVARNLSFLGRAALSNYVPVPATAILLLYFSRRLCWS
jgi:ACR3 family arsenite efflux pump ArsB